MATYKSKLNQTIFDQALQNYGSLENLSQFIRTAPNNYKPFTQGIETTVTDPETAVAQFFANNGINIATGENQAPIPLDISEMECWYNPYDAIINLETSSATFGKISQIRDRSGNGNHANALGTNRATIGGYQGAPYIYLPAAGTDGYETSSLKTQVAQPYTEIFVVACEDNRQVGPLYLGDTGDAADRGANWLSGNFSTENMKAGAFNGNSAISNEFTVDDTTPTPFVLIYDYASGNADIYVDGVQVGTTLSVGSQTMNELRIGISESDTNAGKYLRIFDYIVYRKELSSTDRANLQTYYTNLGIL